VAHPRPSPFDGYWEIVETRSWGLVGGSKTLEVWPGRVCLSPGSFCYCFLNVMRWGTLLHHLLTTTFVLFFEAGSCYITQAGFKLTTLLPQPSWRRITRVSHYAWLTPWCSASSWVAQEQQSQLIMDLKLWAKIHPSSIRLFSQVVKLTNISGFFWTSYMMFYFGHQC
jgi:hypothetical protein